MLGARLKSWVEAQLGRAKKRKQKQSRQTNTVTTGPLPPPHLSSPESAYSTGYSTDGTSPGAPPATLAAPLVAPPPPPAPPTTHLYHEPAKVCMKWALCLKQAVVSSFNAKTACIARTCCLLSFRTQGIKLLINIFKLVYVHIVLSKSKCV